MGKKSPITPAKGYLLLEILENESPESIAMPASDQVPQRGKVIAVGGATWYETIHEVFRSPAKVGQIVVHSGFGFENVRIRGDEYRLLPFGKVLGIFND